MVSGTESLQMEPPTMKRPRRRQVTISAAKRRRCGGFTLVESIFASVILVIGIASSATLLRQAIRCTMAAREQMTTMHQARQWMEIITATGFDDPNLANDWHYVEEGDYMGWYFVGTPAGNARMKDVWLFVRWYNMSTDNWEWMQIQSSICQPLHTG